MSGKHRTTLHSAQARFCTSATVAVAFAGFAAAVLLATAEDADIAPPAAQTVPAAAQIHTPQSVQQQGVIVAVSAESITTRGADGSVQTYRVTPNTTAVTQDGGNTFSAAVPFAVNDEVAIQATVSSGTATATAVADRALIGPGGRPMDAL